MRPNQREIARTLELFFNHEDVFEIRILEARTSSYARPHVESGYFDGAHTNDAVAAICSVGEYKGVYFTPNPVNPDLLSRAANRIRPAGREPTTADKLKLSDRRYWVAVTDAVFSEIAGGTD